MTIVSGDAWKCKDPAVVKALAAFKKCNAVTVYIDTLPGNVPGYRLKVYPWHLRMSTNVLQQELNKHDLGKLVVLSESIYIKVLARDPEYISAQYNKRFKDTLSARAATRYAGAIRRNEDYKPLRGNHPFKDFYKL